MLGVRVPFFFFFMIDVPIQRYRSHSLGEQKKGREEISSEQRAHQFLILSWFALKCWLYSFCKDVHVIKGLLFFVFVLTTWFCYLWPAHHQSHFLEVITLGNTRWHTRVHMEMPIQIHVNKWIISISLKSFECKWPILRFVSVFCLRRNRLYYFTVKAK